MSTIPCVGPRRLGGPKPLVGGGLLGGPPVLGLRAGPPGGPEPLVLVRRLRQ